MKKIKKFSSKSLAVLMSFLMIVSIIPMQALATEILTQNILDDVTSGAQVEASIIKEVIEERSENSKTFLMTDGTYYTYISPISIHELIDGEWVDIDDNLSITPSTISEAETSVKEYIEETKLASSQISTFSMHEFNDEISVECIGNSTQTETGYTLSANGALIIKPETINKFSMANKVLLSATLSTDISYNAINNNRPLYLKHVTSAVSSETTYNDINSYSNIYYKRYDTSKDDTSYTFDITDIYSKWERGNVSNNGVALTCPTQRGPALQISTPILSIRYKDVTANDSSFTYHTLDLGRAGILSINDVTNAFKIEQTIAGLECSLLPVSLIKTIDSSKFSLDSYVNVSSEWNYNYSLSVAGTYATVTLPEGTQLEFEKPQNTANNESYQVWEQITNEDYVDDVELYIKKSSISNNSLNDCYFIINGIEYWFNSLGRLKRIEKADKQLSVTYEYLSDFDTMVISKLTDANGNQYCISYSTYSVNNVNYVYANKIEVKDIDNTPVMYGDNALIINILNTAEDSIIKSTFTYPSETEQPIVVNYYYDYNGKLLSIDSADGTTTTLNYKSEDNTYLTGYEQKQDNKIINTFTITSNNSFERIFEGTLIQKEIQRYDSNFQLITYHYGNNIISMTYENGVIDSYAVNNSNYEEEQNLVDNGDFTVPPIDSSWFEYAASYPDYDPLSKKIIIRNVEANAQTGIAQYIESLSADKTYVFSGNVDVIESIPSNDYAFNIMITFFSKTGTELKTFCLPFDVSLMNESQTRMCAFKTDIECNVMISIFADGNVGEFVVDDIRLYEATSDDGSVSIPTVSTSDPIINTTTNNGLLMKESISDGINVMSQEYEYAEDTSKMISNSDFNGVNTYFDYATRTSKLTEKGHVLKTDGGIENPISYTYNATGLLSTVKQIINNIEPAQTTHLAQYTYDAAERVTSVTNNAFSYFFTYDDIGNITSIQKKAVIENTKQTNNLIDYEYTDNNNVGSIEYSNGYKLVYEYNEEIDNITKIICHKLNSETNQYENIGSYAYTYTNGNISEILLTSNNLAYDVKIVSTETSTDIYHVFTDSSPLVYSKTKTPEKTTEKFISSASGNNTLETFTRTSITETVIGNTTELYSAFSGTKTSAASSGVLINYFGSNNTVKDYFGRVSSKYYTLETEATDTSNNTTVTSSNLSLTHNYSYRTLDSESSSNVTSNLIESMSNTFTAESTLTGVTSEKNGSLSYHYIYDNQGNIRFVYSHQSDGYYYLENYYQYDEANQIVASYGPQEFIFYSYDKDGNIVEKSIGGNLTIIGVENISFNNIVKLSEGVWNTIDWSQTSNAKVSNSEPTKTIHLDYDKFGRLTNYQQVSYTYNSEGNPTETTDIEVDIPYDNYGNPLKYVGDYSGIGTVTADLVWNGNQLESAIVYDDSIPYQKFTFVYDENGYRINKTVFEYSSTTDSFTETVQNNYFWENGILTGLQLEIINNDGPTYMYTNILYDNTGSPFGIIAPTGLTYYFLRDSSNSIRGLVSSTGEIIAYYSYDAFGNIHIDVKDDTISDAIVNSLTALYNPCTYKGYLYDYELGMYFIQNKCYSPKIGRFLNESSLETLTEPIDDPLDANLHLFCNNNPVNSFDTNAEWGRDKFLFTSEQSYGVQVEMSKAFLSRPFCTIYASKIISDFGSWDYLNGRSIKNMGVERIASNLFACCVGNYAESAVNRVNAIWGDGWIVNNRNNTIIRISETDPNSDKYLKIWLAAPTIKAFASASGIYITL